jgi:uncharacterized caspase-like protein
MTWVSSKGGRRVLLGVVSFALFPHAADSGVAKVDLPGPCYVLAIGVDKYNKPYFHLGGAVNDAQGIASAFAHGAQSLHQPVTSIVLTDNGATREAIKGAMRLAVTEIRPDDTFVFFFAGYPFIPSKFAKSFDSDAPVDEFYLVPAGVPEARSWAQLDKEKMISAALLHSWIAQVKAKHQVIIFDSGWTDTIVTTFRTYMQQESRSVENEADKNMVVLASTGIGYEVNYGSTSHGVLTAAIMSGLSGQAAFGRETVTARSLEAYLYIQLLDIQGHYAVTLAQGDDFPLALIPHQVSAEKIPSRGTQIEAGPPEGPNTAVAGPSPALPVQYALLFATDQYDL